MIVGIVFLVAIFVMTIRPIIEYVNGDYNKAVSLARVSMALWIALMIIYVLSFLFCMTD